MATRWGGRAEGRPRGPAAGGKGHRLGWGGAPACVREGAHPCTHTHARTQDARTHAHAGRAHACAQAHACLCSADPGPQTKQFSRAESPLKNLPLPLGPQVQTLRGGRATLLSWLPLHRRVSRPPPCSFHSFSLLPITEHGGRAFRTFFLRSSTKPVPPAPHQQG